MRVDWLISDLSEALELPKLVCIEVIYVSKDIL